jgi:hypothetical protein
VHFLLFIPLDLQGNVTMRAERNINMDLNILIPHLFILYEREKKQKTKVTPYHQKGHVRVYMFILKAEKRLMVVLLCCLYYLSLEFKSK